MLKLIQRQLLKLAGTLSLSRLMPLVRTQAIVSSCSTSGVQCGLTIAYCSRTMVFKKLVDTLALVKPVGFSSPRAL